jgi:peptide-methionine (S)-S-oxide reductase
MIDKKYETAYFGGGCFWCIEAIFQRVVGVKEVISGYAGGKTEDPSYEEVSSEETGHAEVVKILFDPEVIVYPQLLDIFWNIHDPTSLNKQGPDKGTQYRSLILFTDSKQKKTIEKSLSKIQNKYKNPVVTEIKPFTRFYKAEDYHLDFYRKNPEHGYCKVIIDPKINKFFEKYPKLSKREI